MTELNYRDIYKAESQGDAGAFGIKIMVTVDRELTTAERIAAYKAAYVVTEAIRSEEMKRDPAEQKKKELERGKFEALFHTVFAIEELPNGYCQQWCCSQRPWYRVLTPIGWLTIGWLKHMISIDWTESINKLSGVELFPDYEFTRSGKSEVKRYIHAYGYEEAAKLMGVILGQ